MKLLLQIKSFVFIFVIYFGIAAAQASADTNNHLTNHAIGADFGQVFLVGKNYKQYENALGFAARYNYLASDIFELEASLGTSSHGENKELKLFYSTLGLKTNLIYYDKLVPFFVVGFGLNKPWIKITSNDTLTKTLFGFHAAIGADVAINERVSLGVSGNYRNAFTGKVKFNSHDVDVSGAHSALLMRLTVRL